MRTSTVLLVCFALILALTACKKPGNEFLGEWVHTTRPHISMVIERNSGNFLVRLTQHDAWRGKPETKDIPAIYEGGVLVIKGGFQQTTLMVDSKTDLLTDGNNHYKRKAQ